LDRPVKSGDDGKRWRQDTSRARRGSAVGRIIELVKTRIPRRFGLEPASFWQRAQAKRKRPSFSPTPVRLNPLPSANCAEAIKPRRGDKSGSIELTKFAMQRGFGGTRRTGEMHLSTSVQIGGFEASQGNGVRRIWPSIPSTRCSYAQLRSLVNTIRNIEARGSALITTAQ
jgi:hypothetical protein